MVGASLDYEQCVDIFQSQFVKGILVEAGSQILSMHSQLTRYMRVADTHGVAIQQTNGLGQGCSLSITIANLYVSTLLRFLRSTFPNIETGAFLHDRNITTQSLLELMQALEAVRRLDQTAGHCTNIGKSTIFTNNQSARKTLRNITMEGKKLLVKLCDEMVGLKIFRES